MIKLEQLERKMRVNGIVLEQTVELVDVEQSGPSSVRSLTSALTAAWAKGCFIGLTLYTAPTCKLCRSWWPTCNRSRR